jgi:hypothetical protein
METTIKKTYQFIGLLMLNILVIKTFISLMAFISGFNFVDAFCNPTATIFSFFTSVFLTIFIFTNHE